IHPAACACLWLALRSRQNMVHKIPVLHNPLQRWRALSPPDLCPVHRAPNTFLVPQESHWPQPHSVTAKNARPTVVLRPSPKKRDAAKDYFSRDCLSQIANPCPDILRGHRPRGLRGCGLRPRRRRRRLPRPLPPRLRTNFLLRGAHRRFRNLPVPRSKGLVDRRPARRSARPVRPAQTSPYRRFRFCRARVSWVSRLFWRCQPSWQEPSCPPLSWSLASLAQQLFSAWFSLPWPPSVASFSELLSSCFAFSWFSFW